MKKRLLQLLTVSSVLFLVIYNQSDAEEISPALATKIEIRAELLQKITTIEKRYVYSRVQLQSSVEHFRTMDSIILDDLLHQIGQELANLPQNKLAKHKEDKSAKLNLMFDAINKIKIERLLGQI